MKKMKKGRNLYWNLNTLALHRYKGHFLKACTQKKTKTTLILSVAYYCSQMKI